MKIYVKRMHPIEPIDSGYIYSGVYCDGDTIHFNWNEDEAARDIITLKNDISGEYDDDNVKYIYGYTYTSNSNSRHRKVFRDYLKGKGSNKNIWFDEDVENFVENGVLKIENYMRFDSIGAVVGIKPTSEFSVCDVIRNYIMDNTLGICTHFDLIKKAYKDVTFDADRATHSMRKSGRYKESEIKKHIEFTTNKFMELKETGELFQIKRFIPKELRSGFLNYLKFATEEEKWVYSNLQGVNVLIYDDFITSGSTIKEVIRYLRSINENNQLIVFILVKQH